MSEFFTRSNRPIRHARSIGVIVTDLLKRDKIETVKINSNVTTTGIIDEPGPDPEGGCCCDYSVTVSPDGAGDYALIQDAIDFAATMATAAQPWIVHICPGIYTPAAPLIGADFVSLVGLGTKSDGAIIQGSYAFPDNESSLENIAFIPNVSLKLPLITANAGFTGDQHIRNCAFHGVYDTSAPVRFVEILKAATYKFDGCYFNLHLGGSIPMPLTHEFFFIDGPCGVWFRDCEFDIQTDDDDDSYRIFSLDSDTIDFRVYNCRFYHNETDTLGLSTITFLYSARAHGDWYIKENHLNMERTVAGGGTHILFSLNAVGPVPTVYSQHNNYKANAVVQNTGGVNVSTLRMFYDDLNGIPTSPLPAVGTGTFEFILANDGLAGPQTQHIYGPQTIDNPPRVRAFLEIPISHVGATPIVWDQTEYDSNNTVLGIPFYTGGGIFTVPVKGCYHIDSIIQLDETGIIGPGVDYWYQILINGVPRKEFHGDHIFGAHDDLVSLGVYTKLELAAGDQIMFLLIDTIGGPFFGTVLGDPVGLKSSASIHKLS